MAKQSWIEIEANAAAFVRTWRAAREMNGRKRRPSRKILCMYLALTGMRGFMNIRYGMRRGKSVI